MFVADSLFSLEFTVSKLTVTPGVICRFPAVAFRFLDFPTVSLHLLDETQRDRLRSKLNIDPEYKIPEQFKEYQDRSGYFDFNSGKSCLYKIPPDTLRSLLAQVPLYIIVADGFTPTPTLVGSAILPLEELMDDVYEQLLKDGVSVPASSGVKSSLTVYNLMGHAIGQVIVGCRVTSLGMALLTHLPDSSVSSLHQYKPGIYMPSLTVQPDQPVETKAKSGGQVAAPEEQMNISKALLDVADEKTVQDYPLTYIDKQPQRDVKQTQTAPKEAKKRKEPKPGLQQLEQDDIVDEGIELVVPDIYCPPPLYYNKLSRPQPAVPFQPPVISSSYSEATESDSREEEIKQKRKKEAWTSDFGKPLPDHLVIPDNLVLPHTPQKQTEKRYNGRGPTTDITNLLHQAVSGNTSGLQHDGYPVLTALMTEILQIGAAGTPGGSSGVIPPDVAPPKSSSTPLKQAAQKSAPSSPGRRLRETSPLSSKARSAAASPDSVRPYSTSPVLSKPPARRGSKQHSKKGPLVFGYTNTQKLRLSKTNPDLLRRIEESEYEARLKKERARLELIQLQGGDFSDKGIPHSHQSYQQQRAAASLKLKLPKGRRRDAPRSYRSFTSQQPLDISTEMGRLATELAEVKRDLAEQRTQYNTPRFDPSAGDVPTGRMVDLGVTRIITPSGGRVVSPKPSQTTPRRSMSAMSGRNSRDADLSTLHEQSFQSDSRRSLEIHLPTPVLDEGHDQQSYDSKSQNGGKGDITPVSQYTQSSYHTGRDNPSSPSPPSPTPPSPSSGLRSSPGVEREGEDDYSMTFSAVGGENTSELLSPLGYRDSHSYGSESFESEN